MEEDSIQSVQHEPVFCLVERPVSRPPIASRHLPPKKVESVEVETILQSLNVKKK